mgnify:CR=1 FL=1
MRILEKESIQSMSEKSQVSGWLHVWEIAHLEKFPYDPNNDAGMKTLMQFTVGCAKRQSENKELADDGHFQYEYTKRQHDKSSVQHKHSYDISAEKKT